MSKTTFVPGYHLVPIRKGTLGELSKVQEELDELTDAWQQQDRILMSVEIADLYGALQLFVEKHHLHVRQDHLDRHSQVTGESGAVGLHRMQASLDELRRDVDHKNPDVCAMRLVSFYGTVAEFVRLNLPGLRMADVARFAATTRRAFANGRR